MHYKLPIKFVLLWLINCLILIALGTALGLHDKLPFFLFGFIRIQLNQLIWGYLIVGGILAGLEQALWDKLKGQ